MNALKDKRRPIRDYFIQTFSQVINVLSSIITVVIISNLLGAEVKGQVTIFLIIISYFQVFGSIGLPGSALYFTAKDLNSRIFNSNLVPYLLTLSLIFGLITSLIFIICTRFYFDNFFLDLNFVFLTSVGMPIIIFSIFNVISQHILIGSKKFFYQLVCSSSTPLIFAILISIFYSITLSFQLIIIFHLISYFISSILCILFLYKSKFKISFKVNFNPFKEYILYGLKSYPTRIIFRLNDKIDYIIIASLVSTAAVGIYSIAYAIAEVLLFFASAISSIIISYTAGSNNTQNTQNIYFMSRVNIFLILIFAIILIFFSDLLIKTLFIEEFYTAIIPSKILIIGIIFMAIGRIISAFLSAEAKPQFQSYGLLTSLFASVVLSLILIPNYGIVGASISTTVGYLIYLLLMIFFIKLKLSIEIKNILFLNIGDIKEIIYLLKSKNEQ